MASSLRLRFTTRKTRWPILCKLWILESQVVIRVSCRLGIWESQVFIRATASFRWEIPIFLSIEHLDAVELFDNNIIFYQTYDEGLFNLVDKFTVKGGPVVTSEMGAFEVCSQFLYQCEKNSSACAVQYQNFIPHASRWIFSEIIGDIF